MSSINHNLMAANVANNLNAHYGRLATSVQRLSSGLRINSSSDDAAGLAIRELMRADVAALNQGVRNANDAIYMLQVADGALSIIDEKLIRMKELAEQASTGTYNSTQRLIIDSEYKAMADEIDRIARATDFNGIKLLDGTLSGAHNGKGLQSTGALKIHFGTANDSAEDYYYVQIGDCTAKGLGLGNSTIVNGSTTTQVAVETLVRNHKTFKPVTSYIEYTDPDTGNKYYTDGDYWFSDVNNPNGTSLSWETDGALIERLRMTPSTTTSRVGYDMYQDTQTGVIYYSRDNGATFVSDPHNPGDTTLDASADKEIIDRLQKTIQTAIINTVWSIFEDQNGVNFYTCDKGLTYARDVWQPAANLLDSRNPADKTLISTFKPVMETKTISTPKVYITWDCYEDPQTGSVYYSKDGGASFVTSYTKPDGNALNPANRYDKAIIDRLVPYYNWMDGRVHYDVYVDPQHSSNWYYTSDRGKTFVTNYNDPANTPVTDQALAGRLEPWLSEYKATVTYDIYEDTANNHARYYTADHGTTFFSDLGDPSGSLLDSTAPGYAALVANFNKIDATASIEKKYTVWDAGTTNTDIYYSFDDGKTFYRNFSDLAPTLDSANPADQAVIRGLYPNCIGRNQLTRYIRYWHPSDPYTEYYTLKGGPGEIFISDPNDPNSVVLDASNPDQKKFIDELYPVQERRRQGYSSEFPEKYYIYEDPDTGTIYYKPEPDGKTTSRPNDPFNEAYQLDPANPDHQKILDRLKPIEDVKKEIEYITVTRPGKAYTTDLTISTQQAAQGALVAIDRAIVSKDQIRAHLGAMQNRLENTVTNLNIQAENMQNAESRISDADVAHEMTTFVRNQILTQSAVAMLGQANSYPHMLMGLING